LLRLVGLAVVHGGGIVATSYVYGLAVIALAAFATFNLVRTRSYNPLTMEVLQ
jgi:hypothetical protein